MTMWQDVDLFFQIEKFADRLESLKDELRDDFGEWEDVEREEVKVAGLGSMEDLRQLCEEAQEMEEHVQDIVKATKVALSYDAATTYM